MSNIKESLSVGGNSSDAATLAVEHYKNHRIPSPSHTYDNVFSHKFHVLYFIN